MLGYLHCHRRHCLQERSLLRIFDIDCVLLGHTADAMIAIFSHHSAITLGAVAKSPRVGCLATLCMITHCYARHVR
jgi:hypothetical protein